MWRYVAAALAAAMALAAPAGAHAAPCAGGPPAQAVRCLINAQRTANGLPALRPDRRLAAAARGHSAEMVAYGYFGHPSRSGASFASRIAATGWMRNRSSWSVGENLAWGTGGRATPQAIVAAWMASPPHRRTILSPVYHLVGIGVATGMPVAGEGDGATYTGDFGS
jgi:uncharacterized protein YkwD